jgi:hypothetical protein
MRSNERPDTLMQDRTFWIDENLLHRTAGPYIGLRASPTIDGCMSTSAYAPFATEVVRRCNMSRRVDSVEKVPAAVGPNFLRAAAAFYAVRHGGPRQLEQNLSATLFFA